MVELTTPFISNMLLEYCVMSNQTTYKIIKNSVSVKNAKLLEDESFFYVVHYDHMILKVDKITKESLICFPASPSSQRAIEQAFNYIGISTSYLEDDTFRLTGLTKNELIKMFKPKRILQHEQQRKKKL